MNRTCSFKLVEFGNLKALVTVTIGEVELRGFKILRSSNGATWVGMPSREGARDGKREYFDVVRFPDKVARREFCDWLLNAYKREVDAAGPGQAGQPVIKRSSAGRNLGGRRAGISA